MIILCAALSCIPTNINIMRFGANIRSRDDHVAYAQSPMVSTIYCATHNSATIQLGLVSTFYDTRVGTELNARNICD